MNVYFTAVLVLSVTVAVLSGPIPTAKPNAKAADAKKDAAKPPAKKDEVKPAAKKDAEKPPAKAESELAGKKVAESAVKGKTAAAGVKGGQEKKPAQAPAKAPHAPAKHGESKMVNDQPAGKDSGKAEPEPKATKGDESTKGTDAAVTDPATKKGTGKGNDATSCFVNNWKMVVAMTTIAMFSFKI